MNAQIRRAAATRYEHATETWPALIERLENLRREFDDEEVDEILDDAIASARHALECAQENALADAQAEYGDWRRDQSMRE